jgi:hypothetical protein
LFWGAGEILAVEIDDLVDEGLGGFVGFHVETPGDSALSL